MKFTNRVKITVHFGDKLKDNITFYSKGNTEIRGDEKRFIITGDFEEDIKDGKDTPRNIE